MTGEILRSLSVWSADIMVTFGYPGIILVSLLENIITPIPSEAVLPFGGFLTTQGKFNVFFVIGSSIVGSLIGALILYWFGYIGNEKIVKKFVAKYGKWFFVSELDLERSTDFFIRHGGKAVFFGRLVPLVRSLISIPAGIAKLNVAEFIFFTTLGTAIWSSVLVYSGILLGENWEKVGTWIKGYENSALLVILILISYFLFKRIKSKKAD